MLNKKTFKSISVIVLSNLVKLLGGFAMVFLIPMVFDQTHFSYYKLFTIYISYTSIFHIGLIDGIYVNYAGKQLNQAKREEIAYFLKYFIVFLALLLIPLILTSFIFPKDKIFLALLFSINVFIINLTGFFQFLSQIKEKFSELAIRNTILTALNLAVILIMLLFKINNYKVLVLITTLINLTFLVWYMFTYKSFLFIKVSKKVDKKKNLKFIYKLGLPLLLSNYVLIVMTNFPKQFVEKIFPIDSYPSVFANFSFSFTLLSYISVFLSAIGVVIYPILNSTKEDEIKKNYNVLNSLILALVFLLLSGYFPLKYFVNFALPKYSKSMDYFYILAPGFALTSSISVIKQNYFKAMKKNFQFLIIGLLIIGVQILATIYTYNITKEITAIIFVLLGIELIWYISTEIYLSIKMKVNPYKNISYIFITSTYFYLIANFFSGNVVLGTIIYLIPIGIITLLYYQKDFMKLIKRDKEI